MTTTFATYTPAAPTAGTSPVEAGPSAAPQTALRTFRDSMRALVPVWLRDRVGGGILYAIASHMDLVLDMANASVKIRFPGLYTNESLPLIGRERRIRRGRTESDAAYAPRLLRWLDDHARRGNPYALLEQVFAHYAPGNFGVELRYASGRNFVMDTAGNVTRGDVSWSPPGGAARWARWWLIYQWPTAVHSDGIWSDPGTWSDGGVWDCDLTSVEVRDLRLVPREWGAQHAIGRIKLITPGITITISVE